MEKYCYSSAEMARHFQEREYEWEVNRICDTDILLHTRQQTLLECMVTKLASQVGMAKKYF